jgi:hypothetical protein
VELEEDDKWHAQVADDAPGQVAVERRAYWQVLDLRMRKVTSARPGFDLLSSTVATERWSASSMKRVCAAA